MSALRVADLAIALIASAGAPTHADHPKCSGVAPAITRCEVEIDRLYIGESQAVFGYRLFTGTITATIETATGSWSYWCTTSGVPSSTEGCGQSRTGTLASSGKLIGTAEGSGPWVVLVTDPDACDAPVVSVRVWLHCWGPV